MAWGWESTCLECMHNVEENQEDDEDNTEEKQEEEEAVERRIALVEDTVLL